MKDILLAIVVGGVVCAGFCLFITGKYRLKFGRYRYNAREHATVKLRTNEDHFVRQYVTRRKIPKDPPKMVMAEIQARFIRVRADAHLVAAAGDF